MKLQRNNKYNGKIVCGLMTLITAASILCGCNEEAIENVVQTPIPTKECVIEDSGVVDNEIVVKEVKVYKMEKLEGEEKEEAISELGIINNDEEFDFSRFISLKFKNYNNEYKIMLGTTGPGEEPNSYVVYDAFTDTKLFEYKSSKANLINNLFINNITGIYGVNPYFDGAKEICTNVGISIVGDSHDVGIKVDDEIVSLYFPDEGYSNELHFTLYELAEMYVDLIPKDFRVTAADLGIDVNYTEEEAKVYSIG